MYNRDLLGALLVWLDPSISRRQVDSHPSKSDANICKLLWLSFLLLIVDPDQQTGKQAFAGVGVHGVYGM